MTLAAQSLTKRYGAYDAVRDASLVLRPGELVSIFGRSGSGKSTLMAMLGALTRPTEGTVLLDGTDIWALPEAELARFRSRHIGFIFQFPSLLSNLTAVDNVAVPALLGRTMDARDAYALAYDLLARVGLADRADAFPGHLSGGEQRRAVVARALINSPRLVLADEPTSDLDEDTEADIIDLLAELQKAESFGLLLVTHNLELAGRAQRTYEMRQGVLVASDCSQSAAEPKRYIVTPSPPPSPQMGRGSPPSPLLRRAQSSAEFAPVPPRAAPPPIRLGRGLMAGVRTFAMTGAILLGGVLTTNLAVGKYQETQVRERAARTAALQHLALNSLRGDVQSVADLGDGRYELTTYLQNVADGQPIYVMSPELRAYVQVGPVWQEVAMQPVDDSAGAVRKVEGRQTYRYVFDARVREFTQLLPNYMHVRFAGTMLVSPSSMPKDDVFERRDNYYVYLKPFDVADEVVLKRMRFAGKPPVWIPMPPH